MLIERQKRMSRVRFKHPIRVVTLEGQPRVIRTLTANVSRKGLFLRMPEPLPLGTKVALSLEAGGRALALAQAEVVWGRVHQSQLPGRFPGCGVRFTEFMHPRGQELVDYLVHNLDRGKPLLLAPPERAWMRWLPAAGGAALLACAALAALMLWPSSSTPGTTEEEPEGPTLEMVAAPPLVHPVTSSPARVENEAAEAGPVVKEGEASPEVTAGASAVMTQEAPGIPVKMTDAEPTGRVVKKAQEEVALVQPTSTAPALPVVKKTEAEAALLPPPSRAPDSPVAKKAEGEVALVQPASTAPESPVVTKTDAAFALPQPVSPAKQSAPSEKKGVTAQVAGLREVPLAKPVGAPKMKVAPVSSAKSEGGTIKLPSGAAPSLAWTLKGSELRLSPELPGQAQVTRAFVLAGPPRAVFDITGSVPSRSHTVAASPPYSTAVRLGKLPSGTRLVIDLDSAPRRSSQDGSSLVLSF